MSNHLSYADAQSTIKRWSTVGFVFTVLYGVIAIGNASDNGEFNQTMAVVCGIISGLTLFGTLAARGGNYGANRALWIIAGLLGFPLGAVLMFGSGRIRDAGIVLRFG